MEEQRVLSSSAVVQSLLCQRDRLYTTNSKKGYHYCPAGILGRGCNHWSWPDAEHALRESCTSDPGNADWVALVNKCVC